VPWEGWTSWERSVEVEMRSQGMDYKVLKGENIPLVFENF
jgi:hypothetical protein